MSVANVSKIVFSGDLLRVEDVEGNRFKNPQAINVEWLQALFDDLLSSVFPDAKIEQMTGDKGKENSVRWRVFDTLQLPLEMSSWAAIYRDTATVSTLLAEVLGEDYQNSLWITFEAPPYLIAALEKLNATYIDFAVHPIRFLPDYFFGVRSNNPEITEKLKSVMLADEVIYDFARISKSRTVRTVRREYPADNAVFLGQMGADSSLIVDGKMAGIEDVVSALRSLTIVHDVVYYKAHPHYKNVEELKALVASIPKCQWIDINIYDALGSHRFEYFATLSSGTFNEAKYFGKPAKRFLKNPNLYDGSCEDGYIPVYASYLKKDFWKFLFEGVRFDHTDYFPNAMDQAIRNTLNLKWGR